MKIVFMSAIEVEIEDGVCPGCAAVAMTQAMTQLFESGELTLVDDNNCQRQNMETEMHPLSLTVTGIGFPQEEGTMH